MRNCCAPLQASQGVRAARRAGGMLSLFKRNQRTQRAHYDDDETHIMRPDEPSIEVDRPDHFDDLGPDEADAPIPAKAPAAKSLTVTAPRSATIPRTQVKRSRKARGAKVPPMDLLQVPPAQRNEIDEDALLAKANRLAEVLREFGVRGRIREVRPGPVVTLFELEPAAGCEISARDFPCR
jgi:S-DNA-T family DNA segregation ATPase FtsK/SpoIIIE